MKPPRCYEVLELDVDATLEDAARAYRDLATVWHPDRYGHHPRLQRQAQRRLQEINEAYEQVRRCIQGGGGGERAGVRPAGGGNAGPGGTGRSADKRPPPERAAGAFRTRRRGPGALLLAAVVGAAALAAATGLPPVREALDGLVLFRQGLDRIAAAGRRLETHLPDGGPGGGDPPGDRPGREPETAARPFFEIHLKSGAVIGTAAYREEGDMIYFSTAGGSMGLPKSQVREIRAR
jgi:hypothetical protein